MEIQHHHPAWSQKANFAIGAKITDEIWRESYHSEQLAAFKVSENTFVLCCIPFMLYGVSIGDTVNTNKDYDIVGVTKKGGYFTYRVATNDLVQQEQAIDKILNNTDVLHEHFSPKLVAIATQGDENANNLVTMLESMKNAGELIDWDASYMA